MKETGKIKEDMSRVGAVHWEVLKGIKTNMPNADKQVVKEFKKWLCQKGFKGTHTKKKKKSKNGSFAQIKMYSRKPKENIGNAKIGDCRNSNLNHTPEIKPLKMQGNFVNESLPERVGWIISQFLWEGRTAQSLSRGSETLFESYLCYLLILSKSWNGG